MTKHGRGVLMFDDKEPKISGYLIIGNKHYQIVGERISDIRTNLHIRKTGETDDDEQEDMFDDRSQQAGERKQNIP